MLGALTPLAGFDPSMTCRFSGVHRGQKQKPSVSRVRAKTSEPRWVPGAPFPGPDDRRDRWESLHREQAPGLCVLELPAQRRTSHRSFRPYGQAILPISPRLSLPTHLQAQLTADPWHRMLEGPHAAIPWSEAKDLLRPLPDQVGVSSVSSFGLSRNTSAENR